MKRLRVARSTAEDVTIRPQLTAPSDDRLESGLSDSGHVQNRVVSHRSCLAKVSWKGFPVRQRPIEAWSAMKTTTVSM